MPDINKMGNVSCNRNYSSYRRINDQGKTILTNHRRLSTNRKVKVFWGFAVNGYSCR